MKQVNRYRIVQMVNLETRPLLNEEYLNNLIKKIAKYNSKSNNPYLLGKVEVNRRERIITFKKYKIIRNASTLENIDEFTTKLRNEYDLKLLFETNLKNNHPIMIAYRSNKDIKTLPIIYKNNKKYLDKNYIKSLIIKYGKSYEFVTKILENKQIESHARASLDDFDNLYALRESIKNNFPLIINTVPILNFYKSFIIDNTNKIFDYFNFRLLSILLINYEKRVETEKQENKGEIFGQMLMREYIIQELKDIKEDLEIALCDGTLEETYKKILYPNHKTTK